MCRNKRRWLQKEQTMKNLKSQKMNKVLEGTPTFILIFFGIVKTRLFKNNVSKRIHARNNRKGREGL